MINRYWEPATKPPIAWYLCYTSNVTVFDGQKTMFHKPVTERLPYTDRALMNRYERGADVPEKWRVQTFEIVQTSSSDGRLKGAA